MQEWLTTHHILSEEMTMKKNLINPVNVIQWKHDVADI
jgi:hypothetical protein